mmetsp:Transcript_29364/g.33535  ORF Transcript_29364/g.33535 Transcript_29364/m.33535 type:complete len:109 (+) Transcript_29364:140-466(+)
MNRLDQTAEALAIDNRNPHLITLLRSKSDHIPARLTLDSEENDQDSIIRTEDFSGHSSIYKTECSDIEDEAQVNAADLTVNESLRLDYQGLDGVNISFNINNQDSGSL